MAADGYSYMGITLHLPSVFCLTGGCFTLKQKQN